MDDGHALVVRTIREHAGALLRTARRESLCLDDAQDAYQRGLEIFLRRAGSLDPDTAIRWLHVVVRNEAKAVRAARLELVGAEEAELDAWRGEREPDADERVARLDRLSRSAEALERLKPQEATALWLKAQGLSYAEIAQRQNWTYTKVNRALTEGRRAFLRRYAGIEAGEECRRWAPVVTALVRGEATAEQLAAARPHLRRCASCRATVRERRGGRRMPLSGLLPGLSLVQDRLVGWAVRLHGAVEVATASKAAAVAASAAVVIGGGAVTVHEVDRTPARAREASAVAAGTARGLAAGATVTGPRQAGSTARPASRRVTAGGLPPAAGSATATAPARGGAAAPSVRARPDRVVSEFAAARSSSGAEFGEHAAAGAEFAAAAGSGAVGGAGRRALRVGDGGRARRAKPAADAVEPASPPIAAAARPTRNEFSRIPSRPAAGGSASTRREFRSGAATTEFGSG
jgi:RNA polymerase sigma factor (sigma-70 family)